MNKSLLILVALSAVVSSCSQDEVINQNQGNNITFRAMTDKAQTRAGNEMTLANLAAFNVTAIGNGNSYFTDLAVTSNDNGVNWQTAKTFFWPDYALSFYAYSPQTLDGTVSITNTGKTITDFTPSKNVSEQKDLVISMNSGDKATNESSGVSMNFKHALSQVEIKALCDNPTIKVEVVGVKISNMATKGTFTFPEQETNAAYTIPETSWSVSGADEPTNPYTITATDKATQKITLTSSAQSLMFGENNFMLLPQQLTAWDGTNSTTGAYISVLCRIYNVDGSNETLLYPAGAADGKYAYSAVPVNTKWEAGKKYVYTLKFGNGGGEVDPNPIEPSDPENPTEPVDPDVVDPSDSDPSVEGGDEILDAPISFTVTVDDWTEASNDVSM